MDNLDELKSTKTELLEELKKLYNKKLYKKLCDEVKKHSIETLELLATELYEGQFLEKERHHILCTILKERATKLNKNFEWTDENRKRLLEINDKFMQIFEVAYDEALTVAQGLENRIKNNDKFITDYEIEIKINAYMHDQFYDNDLSMFGYVLSEPEFDTISHRFGYLSPIDEQKETPIYLDKSLNWNIEYFEDNFKDNYICCQIHELLDNYWSFYDILNINKIWTDVKVIHQQICKLYDSER